MKLKSIAISFFSLLLIEIITSYSKPIDNSINIDANLAISNLKVVVTQLPDDQYMDVTFVNPYTGFTVSNHGLIVNTLDEGKTWQTVASLGY